MLVAILISFSMATLLFISSFFKKDRTAELEKQFEQLSITYMQDMYQLKKKIQILEEELLISHEQSTLMRSTSSSSRQQLLNEITALHEQGYDFQQIALQSDLTADEVESLLASRVNRRGF